MIKVQMPEVMAHIDGQMASANLFFGGVNDPEKILLYVKLLEKQREDHKYRIAHLGQQVQRSSERIAELERHVRAQPKDRKAQRLADLEAAVEEIRTTLAELLEARA